MKVYFDYQIYYLQHYGGISRYFLELAKELNALNVQAKIIAPYHGNDYLEHAKQEQCALTFNPLLRKVFYNRFINKELVVNEKLLQYFCKKGTGNILHETYYTNRTKVNCPKVITIHDMIYELFNNNLEDEQVIIAQKKQAILEADLIIAVSENTKKDLLYFYPEVKDKVYVVHHGVNASQHSEINSFRNPKPFLLHVGNRGWYKNFNVLLEVFAEQKKVNQDFDLICFGGGTMTLSEKKIIDKFQISDKVKFISGNDNLLISLYKSARALVYISNYEGFGMPLLEAMALGCPVISSNTSSLPEVYGNAAFTINPENRDELINAFDMLYNKQSIENLIQAGKLNASLFTWKKCAQETLKLYQTLV